MTVAASLANWAAKLSDIDRDGFTIFEPAEAGTATVAADLKAAVIDVAERRWGRPFDPDPPPDDDATSGSGLRLWWVLFEDQRFERALLSEPALTAARHLLGDELVLSAVVATLKPPGRMPLPLHTDCLGFPPPLPERAPVCTVTWVLSDYSVDGGALVVVPESHHRRRHPTAAEARLVVRSPEARPVEAPAGSLVVWHGGLWHGARPRTQPGYRMSVAFNFCRPYVKPMQPFQTQTPPEVLERNPPELARLLGLDHPYPFTEHLDSAKVAHLRAAGAAREG